MTKDRKPVGGVEEVVRMLQHMDEASRGKLLSSLAERDPTLTRQIQDKMFTFEDLVREDAKRVQKLLREVPQKQLALAMRGASEELRTFLFGNMSASAAKILREEIDVMPPQKVTDVQVARQQILEKYRGK
jgi:flagellar motor switch protein FliG